MMSRLERMRARAGRSRRGSSLIVLLIVVVIIMIALLVGPFSRNEETSVSEAQTQVERGKSHACAMNRTTIRTDLARVQIRDAAAARNELILQRAMNFPRCPSGGVYYMAEDGEIYCTLHHPLPPDLSANAVRLNKVQPAELTPTPWVEITPEVEAEGEPVQPPEGF